MLPFGPAPYHQSVALRPAASRKSFRPILREKSLSSSQPSDSSTPSSRKFGPLYQSCGDVDDDAESKGENKENDQPIIKAELSSAQIKVSQARSPNQEPFCEVSSGKMITHAPEDKTDEVSLSSSEATAFSDMETELEGSRGGSDSANSMSGAMDLETASCAHLEVTSAQIFYGMPSQLERDQRKRCSDRVRQRRHLRRDSLELARRTTLTLEEVREAADALRMEAQHCPERSHSNTSASTEVIEPKASSATYKLDKLSLASMRTRSVEQLDGDEAPRVNFALFQVDALCHADILRPKDISDHLDAHRSPPMTPLMLSDKFCESTSLMHGEQEAMTAGEDLDCSKLAIADADSTLSPLETKPDEHGTGNVHIVPTEELRILRGVTIAATSHTGRPFGEEMTPVTNAEEKAIQLPEQKNVDEDFPLHPEMDFVTQAGTLLPLGGAQMQCVQHLLEPQTPRKQGSEDAKAAFTSGTAPSTHTSSAEVQSYVEPSPIAHLVTDCLQQHGYQKADLSDTTLHFSNLETTQTQCEGSEDARSHAISPSLAGMILIVPSFSESDGLGFNSRVQTLVESVPANPVADVTDWGLEGQQRVGRRCSDASMDSNVLDSPGTGLGDSSDWYNRPLGFFNANTDSNLQSIGSELRVGAFADMTTPLSERTNNLSWPDLKSAFSPLSTQAHARSITSPAMSPLAPHRGSRAMCMGLATPDARNKAVQLNVHNHSPEMALLKASRDQALALAADSPESSPKRASRVAVSTPQRSVREDLLGRSPFRASRVAVACTGAAGRKLRPDVQGGSISALEDHPPLLEISDSNAQTRAARVLRTGSTIRVTDAPQRRTCAPAANALNTRQRSQQPQASATGMFTQIGLHKSGLRPPSISLRLKKDSSVVSRTQGRLRPEAVMSATVVTAAPGDASEVSQNRNVISRGSRSTDDTKSMPPATKLREPTGFRLVPNISSENRAVHSEVDVSHSDPGRRETITSSPSKAAEKSGFSRHDIKGAMRAQRQGCGGDEPAVSSSSHRPSATTVEVSPVKSRINLSPVKLARGAGSGPAPRARRVPLGSREAMQAPMSDTAHNQQESIFGKRTLGPVARTLKAIDPSSAAALAARGPSSPLRPVAQGRASQVHEATSKINAVMHSSTSLNGRRSLGDSATAQNGVVVKTSSLGRAAPLCRAVSKPVPSVPISSAALATLTAKNSRRNETYYAKLDVVTVKMEGPRPPSPSSKLRRRGQPVEKVRASQARADRARRRATGVTDSRECSVDTECSGDFSPTRIQHRLGSGESEVYFTPARIRSGIRGVKWRKSLYLNPSEDLTGAKLATRRGRPVAARSCLLRKDYDLDRHGNVRSINAPPSPRWVRAQVQVRKLIYDDDGEYNGNDGDEEE